MYHHTKNKGDLGVLKAQVDLHQKGYLILIPHTEHSPFDLVVYKDIISRGLLEIRFRSSYCNTKGIVTSVVDKNEIDVYCVYCPQTDECYYFDPKRFDKSLSLRVEAPKNSQVHNVKFAKDYREVPGV
ncbi:MAG TPA: hypothetical protein K8V56_19445 [Sporosarcina psychrophila]|uniref:PD(D/E)XK endonuclease domain-containing protein n=1 Tax=Sporosarcina psychrophila TaxID=1476 RepID=A0A921G2B1_SPOPS|nr:hypothetical protein [Sporosarcina psychrophila]